MTQAVSRLQSRLSACRGVLVDSNVLLDIATNDPDWGDWSARALSEAAELAILIINPIIYAEISIGYTTIEALDAAVPTTAVSARTTSLGGWFPGRQEFPALPPPRRRANLASARFLHWRACRDWALGFAHARCRPLSQLLSDGRGPRSHIKRDVTTKTKSLRCEMYIPQALCPRGSEKFDQPNGERR